MKKKFKKKANKEKVDRPRKTKKQICQLEGLKPQPRASSSAWLERTADKAKAFIGT